MQPTCPGCKSKTVVYAKRTNSYRCRRCGQEWARSKKVSKAFQIKKKGV